MQGSLRLSQTNSSAGDDCLPHRLCVNVVKINSLNLYHSYTTEMGAASVHSRTYSVMQNLYVFLNNETLPSEDHLIQIAEKMWE